MCLSWVEFVERSLICGYLSCWFQAYRKCLGNLSLGINLFLLQKWVFTIPKLITIHKLTVWCGFQFYFILMYCAVFVSIANKSVSSPKNENVPVFYSPSKHPRCIWLSYFRQIQSELYKKLSWTLQAFVTNHLTPMSYVIRLDCFRQRKWEKGVYYV